MSHTQRESGADTIAIDTIAIDTTLDSRLTPTLRDLVGPRGSKLYRFGTNGMTNGRSLLIPTELAACEM